MRHTNPVEFTEDERAVIEAALRDYRPSHKGSAYERKAASIACALAAELADKFRLLGAYGLPAHLGTRKVEVAWSTAKYREDLAEMSPKQIRKLYRREFPQPGDKFTVDIHDKRYAGTFPPSDVCPHHVNRENAICATCDPDAFKDME